MFTIEEESGTYTGSPRRHNGYYAGDFTRNPVRTARGTLVVGEALAPRPSGSQSGNAD